MFKVGDEVFVKAKIKRVDETDTVRPYLVYIDAVLNNAWITADVLEETKTYEQGLADAWELAKKIYDSPYDGGLTNEAIEEIFGCEFGSITRKYTAEEALAKIEAYEKEIKVNDIVKVKGESGLGIVTAVCPTGVAYVMWKDGSGGDYELSELETTGRTAEGLDLLLRQIKE